ncbi:CASP-like protein 2A1 [Ziziphus jujuba]|uniref:CASP-like protein n=1 Tax=Ziziphus jujuba TaxID=326968 RepID=A0A6P4ANK1_ZIZJJ|nr:CASP-like protein 2A1 [Ziziphus jujuba]
MMVEKIRSEKGNSASSAAAISSSPMAMLGDHQEGSNTTNPMRTAETLLRLLPIAPCVGALVLTLHNSQTNEFGSISYSHLGSFRYLVHANAICAGYSLLSAIISAMPRPFSMSQAWTFFFLDQLLTYLVLGAGAVSTEVLYLAYKGDVAITWTAACETFGRFCHKGTASVAITFLVVACYAMLSLISSYKLFSKYEAPLSKQPTKGIEVATFHG